MTLVPTSQLAENLRNLGFDNVRVMQRGVDTGLFNPMRRSDALRTKWQADSNTIVCLYVGRIAVEKNIHQAIETVQALAEHYPIRFVLVGDGPLRESLAEKHPAFIFSGTRLGEDLAAHYASADVLLFPSRTETFGNVVTEAMASGLATLAYDEAAAHEHIDNWENGLLASNDGTHNFTASAMRLCKQPETIRRIGHNASVYCRKLGWPAIIDQFESLLLEASMQAASASGRSRTPEPSA
jgi:glycosyltransferase involved in cell wall biosynthesis